jgi:hypothetical protein
MNGSQARHPPPPIRIANLRTYIELNDLAREREMNQAVGLIPRRLLVVVCRYMHDRYMQLAGYSMHDPYVVVVRPTKH